MIPRILFLCAFIVIAVVWTLLFFNIENNFFNFIFIVIVLGVNRSLVTLAAASDYFFFFWGGVLFVQTTEDRETCSNFSLVLLMQFISG